MLLFLRCRNKECDPFPMIIFLNNQQVQRKWFLHIKTVCTITDTEKQFQRTHQFSDFSLIDLYWEFPPYEQSAIFPPRLLFTTGCAHALFLEPETVINSGWNTSPKTYVVINRARSTAVDLSVPNPVCPGSRDPGCTESRVYWPGVCLGNDGESHQSLYSIGPKIMAPRPCPQSNDT